MSGVGELIAGRYRVVRPLGAGGLGRVWLAIDEMLDRPVAIKKCASPTGLTQDENELLRSLAVREARAAARVSHPHVVGIYDVLPAEDQPWIVMEYVASKSLLQLIDDCGPLPPDRVARIGLALLSALEAAARAGVLHLDVKPSNVLIAADGRVVLSDFGPAVTGEGVAALARSGMILGSPNYLAPERLFDGVSTAAADLWSLGATLYHAVEGRPPYLRDTPAATLQALADGPPDPARRAGPLGEVLDGLLRRDPADRMRPAEAEVRLRRVAEPPAVPAAVPVRAPRRTRRWATRPVAAAAMACAIVGVLAVLTGGTGLPGTGADPPADRSPSVRAATFVLPSEFRWWDDPSGFQVAVPTGWPERADRGSAVAFHAPGGQPSLRISAWTPGRDVLAALVERERLAALPAYRRTRIETLPHSSDAIWEYTFRDSNGTAMRGLERVKASGGSTYLLEWRTPRSTWTAHVQKLSVVLDSFHAGSG